MRRAARVLLAALTVATAAAASPAASATPQAAGAGHAGRLAPAFSLRDLSGRTLDSARYRGKVVLLDFWATWCAPCREELPQFAALQQKYRGRGFAVVGISMDDTVPPVQRFVRQYPVNFPVAMGSARLAETFGGVLGLPVAFLIDREGRIARRYDGQTDPATLERTVVALLEGTEDGR